MTVSHILANPFESLSYGKQTGYRVDRYAGVYVPTIARTVVRDPAGINLAGFAVGDGCMGTEVLCGHREGP